MSTGVVWNVGHDGREHIGRPIEKLLQSNLVCEHNDDRFDLVYALDLFLVEYDLLQESVAAVLPRRQPVLYCTDDCNRTYT